MSKGVYTIPIEIAEFFNKPGGRSLMVKGGAGTGKTTLALQILEQLAEPDKSFYLSTRVSDEALYNQFPWLRDKEMRTRIVDASKMLLESLYQTEKEDEEVSVDKESIERIATARTFLKTISEEHLGPVIKVDRTKLTALIEQNRMPEIERIYDRIEHNLPDKSMLVIDSLEGVTHKYGLEMEELLMTLQKDLVENSNTNLLLVLEKPEAGGLEYLVDGVATLARTDIEKRRIRLIHIEKLRATEIRQPYYLLTLQHGRFRSFLPFEFDYSKLKPWAAKPESNNRYSTGIDDLDKLLGGGFIKGSFNVFEIGENVTSEDYFSILRPIFLNFLAHNRGIMAVLPGGDAPENVRTDFTRFIPKDLFDRFVRIADYFAMQSTVSYVMPLGKGSREEVIRTWRENENQLRGKDALPIIEFTGFDAMEYIQGDTPAIRGLLHGIAKTKASNDLALGLLKPGLKVSAEIYNMADTYFKIIDIHRCPAIYGVKPKTMIYAIIPDETRGPPHVKFVPIV